MVVTMSSFVVTGLILLCVMTDLTSGIKVVAEGSIARERVDAIFLRCDVINLDQEDEIVRVTWRHNDSLRGVWSDIFTVDLTNDVPAYFFLSQWAGRGQYNPISLAAVLLSPAYVTRYLSGTYRCDVETTNSHSHAHTFVDVYYGPGTSITITPGGRVQKTEGEELLLTCHAQCNPSCSYRWYKSGKRLSSSSTLRMAAVSRQDGGLYACQARNEAGRSIKPVDIRVLYPPSILSLTSIPSESLLTGFKSGNGNGGVRKEVMLECRIKAWPEPEIRWFKGPNLIQNVTEPPAKMAISSWLVDLEHKTSRLKVQNASCLDNGLYFCKAHNSVGEVVTREINVTQNCPPFEVFDSELCPVISGRTSQQRGRLIEIEKKFGEEVTIRFCFTGYPTPMVRISKGSKTSNHTQEIRQPDLACNEENKVCVVKLSFVVTKPDQYGSYDVKVFNEILHFTKTYHIISRQAPFPPRNVTMTTVTSTSACFSWNPRFNGGEEQVFNLTYIRVDSNSDSGDDVQTAPATKYVILRKSGNSWVETNYGKGTFINMNSFDSKRRLSELFDAGRTHHKSKRSDMTITQTYTPRQIVNKTRNHDRIMKNTVNSSTLVSTCVRHLIPSSTYSIIITSSNVFGKSRTPDGLMFKTLDAKIASSSQSSTTSSPSPPPQPLPRPTYVKTSRPTFKPVYESPVFIAPSNQLTTTNRSPRKRGQGHIEQLPIHDESQASDDVMQTEKPHHSSDGRSYHSDKVKSTPLTGESKYTISSIDGDSFWNSEEDGIRYYINNNNNNNRNNMNDNAVGTPNYDDENNDDNNYDDDNSDNDGASNELYDNDDFVISEENTLFQMLFPYFRSVLFNDNVDKEKSNNRKEAANSNAPQGPFEVERYFKKYAPIEKWNHVPVALDSPSPFNNTLYRRPFGKSHQESTSTGAPKNISVSTLASPGTNKDSYDSLVTSSISIGSVVIAVFALVAIILKLVFKRRRWYFRKRSQQNSTTSLPSRPGHGRLDTSTRTSGIVPLSSRMRSNTNSTTSQNCQNSGTTSNSEMRYCTQNNTTNQKLCYRHHSPNTLRAKHLSINTRPRLSTPKSHRKDRHKCSYANPNSNTNTKQSSAPKSSVVNEPSYSNSNQNSPNPTLTIPGISVNNKRISSPSYLELCMGSSSSCESVHHHNVLNTLPSQTCENQKRNELSKLSDDHYHGTRRSSYSSIIIPDDVMENSNNVNQLDTTGKWNSYLDLCEALSVKSGSRSPSNIYDPLDICDKISIRSVASYMSPHTPELARRVLEGNHFNSINRNQSLSHLGEELQSQQQQQRSPRETTKNILKKAKNKLGGELEPSESDSSSHYEKCVSLTYDKYEIDEIKKRNALNINESMPTLEANLKSISTTNMVEYMNERNVKYPHNIPAPEAPRCSNNNNHKNTKLSSPSRDVDTDNENNNSVYNEIDVHAKENDGCVFKSVKLKHDDSRETHETILPHTDLRHSGTQSDNIDQPSKRTSALNIKHTKQNTNDKAKLKRGEQNSNSREMPQNWEDSKQRMSSLSGESITPKCVRSPYDHPGKPEVKGEISRHESGPHSNYYSDIDADDA